MFAGLYVSGLEEHFSMTGQTGPVQLVTIRFKSTEGPQEFYATAIFQDFNGNGRLDRTPLGLP